MSVRGEPAAAVHVVDAAPAIGGDTIRLEIRVVRGRDRAEAEPPSASPSGPLLLRVEEAARMLAISRATLYPMLGRQIPVVRIGRAVRVPRAELERYLTRAVDAP
jgi:excisionase family DNA binding protein